MKKLLIPLLTLLLSTSSQAIKIIYSETTPTSEAVQVVGQGPITTGPVADIKILY